jgi:hypothetical protein
MTREWRSLKHPRAFLESALARRSDHDLIGQVEYWSIGRQVFQSFGADVHSPAATQRPSALEELRQAYEDWRRKWPSTQHQSNVDLYFQTAKLRLLSHIFRGPSAPTADPMNVAKSDEIAMQAIDSAIETVRQICSVGSGDWLETLPSYFSTMIAFACVCLIKVCSQDRGIEDTKKTHCRIALSQFGDLLRSNHIAGRTSHPLMSIAKGLEMVTIMQPPLPLSIDNGPVRSDEHMPDFTLDFEALGDNSFDWSFAGLDDNWMTCPQDFGTETGYDPSTWDLAKLQN